MRTNKSNKLMTTVGIFALVLSGTVAAKGRGLDRIDTDGSGTVELQEMIDAGLAKVAKRFEKLDTDVDGYISLEEFLAARPDDAVDLSLYADEIVACVEAEKAESGNEAIEVPEAGDFLSPEDRFASKDTDSDGYISLAEAEANAEEKATTKFNNLDADEDGSVTKEEFTANREARSATRRAVRACIDEVTSEDII